MASPKAFPVRPLSRVLLSLVLSASVLARPSPATAQDEQETLIRDTEIEEILHADADPILRAAGIEPKTVQIALIGSKELNAFAAPRLMGINTGLILKTKNPNQLQGVIAHEVATWPPAIRRAPAKCRRRG